MAPIKPKAIWRHTNCSDVTMLTAQRGKWGVSNASKRMFLTWNIWICRHKTRLQRWYVYNVLQSQRDEGEGEPNEFDFKLSKACADVIRSPENCLNQSIHISNMTSFDVW